MKIEIEVTPEHWWIEKRGASLNGKRLSDYPCAEAMVRLEGKTGGKDYKHEEYFKGTPEQCLEFVRKYFPKEEQ